MVRDFSGGRNQRQAKLLGRLRGAVRHGVCSSPSESDSAGASGGTGIDSEDVMRWGVFALLLIHGAIHLMGFAKAFGFAALPRLSRPISRGMGIMWLVAALLFLVTAVLFGAGARVWWPAGLAAVLLSQAVIFSAWSDAKFGTIANLLIALAVYGFASQVAGTPAGADSVVQAAWFAQVASASSGHVAGGPSPPALPGGACYALQSLYLPVAIFLALILAFAAVSLAGAWLIRPNRPSASKAENYECGAQPIGEAWVQFPVGFYLVALLFLVFDTLAVFLFPWAVTMRVLGVSGLKAMLAFVAILSLAWVYAYREGILEWK
jgi:NADH-quinone oxidoreductase subunit A